MNEPGPGAASMRSLIVGYGHRGERHSRVLTSMGHEVAVVSRRHAEHPRHYTALEQALFEFQPNYVIIANEVAAHRASLVALRGSGFGGPVLVEKPLFNDLRPDDPRDLTGVYVGYNLRFDLILLRLRDWVYQRAVVAATIHVGHRPGTGGAANRSLSPNLPARLAGAGVLRELSHELDYTLWLFGAWRRVVAIGGTTGAIGPDVDDCWNILIECERCPQVSIGMSYLEPKPRRRVTVTARDNAAVIDFIDRTYCEGARGRDLIPLVIDESCRLQHAAILSGDHGKACTYAEGYEVVRLIDAIERSAATRVWIES